MNATTRLFVLLTLLATLSIPVLAEDQPPPPCSAPEFRQFDFWVGEWNLTWPDSGKGSNTITRELDSCVIEENFTTLGDAPFQGNSVSTYRPKTGKWYQTWVDNQGGYLDFEGEFNGTEMILGREAVDKDGKPIQQRMVWKNIAADSLDWSWELSRDSGVTWEVRWPIHYVRRK